MKVRERLTNSIRSADVYNPEIQVAPACILWPDRERQWEAVVPQLQREMPELLLLGDYAPENRAGPAIWLRCAIAGQVEGLVIPAGIAPILYLPGVGRQDLRAVESCPEHLKPLAELQYRGVIWSQVNAKDWTLLAYLKSDQGGLGLDVAQDNETKSAMQLALHQLLDEELELLVGKRLDRDYFNKLLSGGDPIRDLLQWLDREDAFRDHRDENQWRAFVQVCKSQLAFDPQAEGVLAGAARLAEHRGPWLAVWERFCEAPGRYPDIPGRIRQCTPPAFDLFTTAEAAAGWPQWNEAQENELARDLLALAQAPAHQASKRLLDLEKHHAERRRLVWAELGEAPLACAMEHLASLAEVTQTGLAAGSADDLAAGYRAGGWRADDALVQSLASLETGADLQAVAAAVRAVYLPWAEDSARHLQKSVDGSSYPGGSSHTVKPAPAGKGECILFVDGLRFDTGKRLAEMLEGAGYAVAEAPKWAALPSVTGTGKPAVAPIADSYRIQEDIEGYNFERLNQYQLHKAIRENDCQVLLKNDCGDGKGPAWCEFGDIDSEGHERGWKLARHLDLMLGEIRNRVADLLAAGWQSVRIVTDHGWLLLPGGLPKVDLPGVLTDTKWGRCAALKSGASCEERLYPWYWNPHQQFALADGISCFKAGEEYTHGGLSLQECLTLELKVSPSTSNRAELEITDVVWKGLRCTVAVDGSYSGLSLDIRTRAGEPASSVVLSAKPLKDNGTASVVVEDEDLQGRSATLVLIDSSGGLVRQLATVIGGEKQ